MLPRFLQTPSEQHMESSSKCPAARMTELYIQIKLENEGIPKFGVHSSRALLKDLALQHISLHTNKI